MNINNTTAHARYEAHVKESLLTGKHVQCDLKDFQPNQNTKKRKSIAKPKRTAEDYRMKTVTEVVEHLDSLINALTEQFQLQKESDSVFKQERMERNWSEVQTLKAVKCSITGETYVYEHMPY